MHDALRQVRVGPQIDQLAAVLAIAPAEAGAVMRTVMPEFAWYLETMTLSRGGLADLVELLGAAHPATAGDLRGEAARRTGEEILARVLGTTAASRTLAARTAPHCGVAADAIAAMLPHLCLLAVGALA